MNEEKVLLFQVVNEGLSKIGVEEKFTVWNTYVLYNPYIEYMSKLIEVGNMGHLISVILNKKEDSTFL